MDTPFQDAAPPAASNTARAVLRALERGEALPGPCTVVVAHPDDETLGLGLRLPDLGGLQLVHVTDGAPSDEADAFTAGFDTGAAYAGARARELEAAMGALGVGAPRRRLGVVDQDVALRLCEVAPRLATLLTGSVIVFTHAYEGGHPDHDATAFAVQAACALLRRDARPTPMRLEFAGYHRDAAGFAPGRFWPDPARPEVRPRTSPKRLAAKRRALAAYASQAKIVARFPLESEAYRQAPDYDFTNPPPPGACLYDDYGWTLTSGRWRALAGQALAELGLAAPD